MRVSICRVTKDTFNKLKCKMLIRYSIPRKGKVTFRVYDVTGRCVRTFVNSKQKPGIYTFEWRGKDNLGGTLPTGVYFLLLKYGERRKRLQHKR